MEEIYAGEKTINTVKFSKSGFLSIGKTAMLLLLFLTGISAGFAAPNVTTITIQSGSNPTCSGSSVTFRATNSCATTGVTYQWRINGVNVPGATASTFTTTTLTNGNVVTCVCTFTGPGGCSGSPTTSSGISMVVNTPPTVNAGGPNTVCQSSTPSAITLSGASYGGGATAAAWSITSGGGSLSTTALTTSPSTVTYTPAANFSGTVTLTLTTNAPSGCTAASATRTITVNAAPTVSAGSAVTICQSASPSAITLSGSGFGGSATLAAWSIVSGGGTLSNTAQTTSPSTITYTPAANFSGTVTLRITSDAPAGCAVATATKTITVNPLPTLTSAVQAAAICEGNPATINLSGLPVSSTLSLSYTISGGAPINVSVSSNASGTASFNTAILSAANNGDVLEVTQVTNSSTSCSQSFNETLTLSVGQLATVNAGSDQSVCAGETINLSSSFGGSASSGTWSASSGTFSNVNSVSSTYTPSLSSGTVVLTFTTNDPAGACPAVSDNLAVTVNALPVPTLSPGTAVCENASGIVYSTQPGNSNYVWSVTGGTITSGGGSGSNTATVAWGAVGTGHLYINYTNSNGCTAASSTDHPISINPHPTLSDASQAAAICEGNGAVIQLTGLIAGTTSSIAYNINGGATLTANGVVADASGNGSFTTPNLTAANDGQTLTITGVTITSSSSNCNTSFSQSLALSVLSAPVLTSTLNPPAICSGTTFSYTPVSDDPGATFSWSRPAIAGISQAASSGSGDVSEVLTNTTSSPINVNYQYVTINGCSSSPQTVTVTVNPSPVLSSSLTPAGICSGSTFNYTPTSATAGASFSWSRAAVAGISEAASSGTGNISEELNNTGTAAVSVTYIFVTTANGCVGSSQNVTVSVKPVPVLSSTLTPASICSGTAFAYTPASSTSGTTYTWSRAAIAGITPATSSGSGNVSETLTNTTANDINVTYVYTSTAAGCSNTGENVVVVVKPRPVLNSTLAPAAICSGTTFSYTPTSATTGSTFAWTRAAVAGISQAAGSGSGNVSEVLTNTTAAAINVTYVYTTTANGCSGSSQNVIVSVKPSPVLSSTLTPAAICSGSTFGYTPASATSGSSFAWTRAAVAGISQAASSGTGSISEVLTNTTASSINVTYVYTTTANGCSGPNQNVVVTIKPMPVLSSTLTPAAICSGSTFTYTPTSATTGTTFTWSKPAVAGISQAASTGSGNVSTVLTNTTNNPINVTFIYTSTANGCTNSPQNVVVTVNPKPNVSNFSTPSATTVCAPNGSVVTVNSSSLGNGTFTVTYNLTDQNIATGNTATLTMSGGTGTFTTSSLTNTANNGSTTVTITAITNSYGCTTPVTSGNNADFMVDDMPTITSPPNVTICSGMAVGKLIETDNGSFKITWWANADNPNVTGESLTPQSPANKKISDVLTNLTTVNQIVYYTAVPTSTNQGCTGPSQTITVTVKPAPNMTSGTTATICSEGTFSIPLSANMTSTYTWVATDNTNTTGESLTAQNANPMSNTIISSSPAVQAVLYAVYATSTATLCNSPIQTVTITVNPKPVLSSALTQGRCSGAAGSYTATSATTGVTFNWTRAAVAGISNAAASGSGATVNETLVNTTTAPVTAVYTFSMSANGCSNNQNVQVTVNPLPRLTAISQAATVCAGTTAVINLSGLLPNVTSTITYNINGGASQTVTGLVSNGSGAASFTTPVLTAANNGQSLTITSVVTTSTSPSCSQAMSVSTTLSVTPIASLNSSLTPPAICSGNVFAYTPTSAISGVSFTWTRAAVAGISQAASSGSGSVSETLTNTGTTPVNVTYSYTTTNNGCSNTPQNVVVTVNPACTVAQPSDLQECDGNAVTINFTGTVTGTSYSWTNDNTSIGLGASGTGSSVSFTANCTSTTTATITVTPTANGCTGTSRTFTITVRRPGSWIGVVSTDWFDPANWDCNIVPDETIDVTIPATAPFMPIINGPGAECKSLNVNPGSNFCTFASENIDIYGNWVNNGTCTHNTGNVTFRGTCAILGASNNNFHNVTILGSLTAPSSNINIGGNWTNNGSFNANGGTVTFNGTSAQTIGGTSSTVFNNMVMNSAGVTLLIPTTVNGALTLTNGEILTTATNILTLGVNATTGIGHAGSFVQGPMKYIVATTSAGAVRNLPIGKDLAWRPAVLRLSHSDATPVTYTAEVINESAEDLMYTMPPTVTNVSNVRYWQIDRQSVSNFINAQVELYYGSDDGVADYTNATVVKNIGTGTVWYDIGGTASGNGSGSIISNLFNTFSKFTLGNRPGGGNPLPVELVAFTAKPEKNRVDLKWTTASEVNNDYFTVERTKDGSSFVEITKVDGAGMSSTSLSYSTADNDPLNGLAYYRLKQTDYDGNFRYSELVPVTFRKSIPLIVIYPNPAEGSGFNMRLEGYEQDELPVTIYDASGKVVFMSNVILDPSGSGTIQLASGSELASGLYCMRYQLGGEMYTMKLFIK